MVRIKLLGGIPQNIGNGTTDSDRSWFFGSGEWRR